MPSAEPRRSFRRAIALGLIQGPSELLPVSSSAHTRLIPRLAGWEAPEDDGRSFEVALHGAASLALALEMGGGLRRELGPPTARRMLSAALALAPPAIAGLALRGQIEARLSGPRASAGGLLAGAAAMALADGRAEDPGRNAEDAGPLDGLLLGLAQAAALAPGISRNGATLTVARARGFSRPAAQRLSWGAGLPVMGAASAVEALRIGRDATRREGRPLARGASAGVAAGVVAAFCSTRLSARLLARRLERRPLWPYAIYRCLLAGLILVRTRRAQ